jgi:hypothetical protein
VNHIIIFKPSSVLLANFVTYRDCIKDSQIYKIR